MWWRRGLGVTIVALIGAYIVSPYQALYRLSQAAHAGDAATVEQMVDWDGVREGIKEDVCDYVIGAPSATAGNTLPPFGSGFVRGIAGTAIDANFTPDNLVAAARTLPEDDSVTLLPPHVEWAFFTGPTSFELLFDPPGQSRGTPPVRVEMELRDGGWRVIRAYIPPVLLRQADARS